jgi:hypothetical protein
MTLYVDDVRHPFRRMVMCHMWATTVDELHEHAAALGLRREWFQAPPKASWEHYDVSLSVKARALSERGAVLTDKYGPVEHVARLRIASGDPSLIALGKRSLTNVAAARSLKGRAG